MATQKNLMTLCIATVFTLGLAACGGGGGDDAPVTGMMDDTTMDESPDESPMIAGQTIPSGTEITLPADVELQDGTLRADMDETITVGDIGTFTCVSAEGCSVDLTDGVITTSGDITVVSLDVTDAGILAQLAAVLPPEPVELNELETAQADAAAAATAAMTAAGNAATSATEATEAVANLATVQTGETSRGLATKAGEQAALAHAAYMTAKTASDDAEAATDVTAAVRAQVDAENATADATAAEAMAGEYGQMAVDAAGNNLMIVDTVKSVGDTSVDAEAPASTVASGTGADRETEITGLIDDAGPSTMGPQTLGQATVPEDATEDGIQYKAPVANADARPLTIGKTVDSDDDAARLTIVTKYASTQTVKVFARANGATDDLTATKPGVITVTVDSVEVDRPLTSVGMYYRASGGTVGEGNLEADDTEADEEPQGDSVGVKTEPVEVFSYEVTNANDVTTTEYVVLHDKRTEGSTTDYSYATADIHLPANPDGEGDNEATEVTAKLPVAKPYSHIHFGVWAALGNASSTGAQNLADLGIGFVQSIGDGLTADMPNGGTGNYAGNWVASVQDSHPNGEGNIRQMGGAASLEANFRKGAVDGTLSDLATFEADIDGASFETDGVEVTASSLDADAKWTGGLSGAFYGDDAMESGGVFSFATKDNEGGAFTGAFGTVRTDE